jgi:hypothetical protein
VKNVTGEYPQPSHCSRYLSCVLALIAVMTIFHGML